MSTFSFSAHSWQSFVRVSLAPGTQWSQNPTASLPAAKAPWTKGAGRAPVAAVCKSVRRVSRETSIETSLCNQGSAVAPAVRLEIDVLPRSFLYSSAGCSRDLAAHKAFELASSPIHGLVHRFSLLGVL